MSRTSFFSICSLLQQIPDIFESTGLRPQKPVEVQFANFLRRCAKTNSHHVDAARETGTGSGTTFIYLDRIAYALVSIRQQHVKWPTGNRRRQVREAFGSKGFYGALGAVDGMLIQLTQKPHENGIYYYCRKKFYGINVQATVDHEGYFTSYDVGWPASQNDISIYMRSTLHHDRNRLFRPGEYLLADKGR
jgi:hypothetical protein